MAVHLLDHVLFCQAKKWGRVFDLDEGRKKKQK